MRLTVEKTPADVARAAADWLRDEIEAAVAQRGRCVLAFSGGRSPWQMLTALADEPLPWDRLQVLQVDDMLSDLQMLMRRLAGEKVALELKHGRDLWLVKAFWVRALRKTWSCTDSGTMLMIFLMLF